MSETVTRIGKLVPLDDQFKSLIGDARYKAICETVGLNMEDYCDTWKECFREKGYGKYYEFGGVVYRVDDNGNDPYSDIFEAHVNNDNTVNYIVQYYSGGCGFHEALDYAMKNKR